MQFSCSVELPDFSLIVRTLHGDAIGNCESLRHETGLGFEYGEGLTNMPHPRRIVSGF
jgi:hypothetical protein